MESCDIHPEVPPVNSPDLLPPTTELLEGAQGKETIGLSALSAHADFLRFFAGYASAKLVEQRQWEPVAMPMRKRVPSDRATAWNARIEGFNECLDQVERLGPLYSIAGHEEFERLREGLESHLQTVCDQRAELDELRAQLAERDALLREVGNRHWPNVGLDLSVDIVVKIQALSASADSGTLVDAHFREHFEKILPVPPGITWSKADQNYKKSKMSCCPLSHLASYQSAWRAWCARGHLDHHASHSPGGAA